MVHGSRSAIPVNYHLPSLTEEEEESPPRGRSCYIFNPLLRRELDDTACTHCRFYLTHRCPRLDEFLDDVEDLSPD
jgi:hypothetical protein